MRCSGDSSVRQFSEATVEQHEGAVEIKENLDGEEC